VFLAIAVDNLANAQEMTAREEEEERLAQEIRDRTGKDPFVKEEEVRVDADGKVRPPVKKKKKKDGKDPVPEPFVPIKKKELVPTIDIEKSYLSKCEMDFIPGLDTEDLKIILPDFYEKPFFEYAEEVKEKKRAEIREERERLKKLKAMQDKINEEKNGGDEKELTEEEKAAAAKKAEEEENEEIEIPEPAPPKPPPPPPSDDPDMIVGPRPIVPYSCCFILDHEGP